MAAAGKQSQLLLTQHHPVWSPGREALWAPLTRPRVHVTYPRSGTQEWQLELDLVSVTPGLQPCRLRTVPLPWQTLPGASSLGRGARSLSHSPFGVGGGQGVQAAPPPQRGCSPASTCSPGRPCRQTGRGPWRASHVLLGDQRTAVQKGPAVPGATAHSGSRATGMRRPDSRHTGARGRGLTLCSIPQG